MVKITCSNPRCPAKAFMWNELSELASPHDVVEHDDPEAVRLVVNCTYCGAENVIWVRKSGIKSITLNRGNDQ